MASPIKPNDSYLVASTPHQSHANKSKLKQLDIKPVHSDPLESISENHRTPSTRFRGSHRKVLHMSQRSSVNRAAGSSHLDWTSKRASRLFNLLTRPPLLFSPSLGIRLPFSNKQDQGVLLTLPSHKRNRPIDPDPCLLSIDGLLDCLLVTNALVDQVYHDCMDAVDEAHAREYEHSPTVLAANFFLRRVKPVISRLSELRLRLSDFKLGACVGRGACGIVRVVREVAPPHSVFAMKSQFKGAWLHHDPEGSQILLERTVLAQAAAIENPWLPHLHYAFQDEKQLHLVMDYEPGGDLYIFLNKVGHLLDSSMIQFYAAEAVEAVHSLHQMGYIHCDLKPENFAIERSGHLKLIDFGSAIRLDADGKCICPTMVGTKEYLNIELLRQRGRHNQEPLLVGPEFDYWAIGVLLYELFYGQTPFYDEDDDTMMEKIMDYKKTLKFPKTVDIPDCAIQLIRSLIVSPSRRLTYEDLVVHPFFKDVDFSALRQVTPPYLPPVGELDDVSNFSGGGSRHRDEAILDVSTNQTFSPSFLRKSSAPKGNHSHCVSLTNEENEADETVLVKPVPNLVNNEENQENIDPQQTLTTSVLTIQEAKRQAIQEAAAGPINEEIEEIEDIEWQGSDCVRNLPFLGYTYTPGLVLFGNLNKNPATSTTAITVGTSMHANIGQPFTPNRDSPCVWMKPISGPNSVEPLKCNENLGNSDLTNISELQQRNQRLCEQIEQLRQQNKESEELCQRLADAFDNGHVLKEINEAVRVLSHTVVEKEKSTVDHLNNRIKQLQEENTRLVNAANTGHQTQCILDQIQNAVSRLSSLPGNFTEADLVDLLTSLCPPIVESSSFTGEQSLTSVNANNNISNTNEHHNSSTNVICTSDNLIGYELIHRIINFALKQFKQATDRVNQSCYTLESANHDLKKALETSKQQVTHLVNTLDGLIADQRQARECENNLNKEIQELKQRLEDSREYQRNLHQKYLHYEDKYFATREQLREQEKKNKEFTDKIEQLVASSMPKISEVLTDSLTQSDHLNLLIDRNKEVESELIRSKTTLEQAKIQHQIELSEIKRQLEEVKSERDRLIAAEKAEKLNQEKLEQRVETAENQLSDLRDQISSMLSERGVLITRSALESQRLSDLQLHLNDAIMKKEAAEVALQEALLKLDRLNTTQNQSVLLDQMRHDLESTRSKLRNAESEIIHHKEAESKLQECITNYERDLTDLKQENSFLRERYDRLQSTISLIGNNSQETAVTSSQSEYVAITNENRTLKDEVDQMRCQLERIRLNNTQLLSQRDVARQEAREADMATLRAKELGEATQQALEREIHRLSTITEQQGKLINHMRGLLPPELTKAHRTADSKLYLGSEFENFSFYNRSHQVRKSVNHKGFARSGAPLISAASTFFSRRRKPDTKTNELMSENVKTLPSNTFFKQPSRLQKIMSKSRLNFKKRGTIPIKTTHPVEIHAYNTESDNCFTEDEDPLGYDPYSADDIDFDDGLPVHMPAMFAMPHPPKSGDCASDAGSSSSVPSTASSAPPGPIQFVREQSSWRRHKSKNRVGWADENDNNVIEKVPSTLKHRSQPRLLKQLSKVLGRSKHSSTHLDVDKMND